MNKKNSVQRTTRIVHLYDVIVWDETDPSLMLVFFFCCHQLEVMVWVHFELFKATTERLLIEVLEVLKVCMSR